MYNIVRSIIYIRILLRLIRSTNLYNSLERYYNIRTSSNIYYYKYIFILFGKTFFNISTTFLRRAILKILLLVKYYSTSLI